MSGVLRFLWTAFFTCFPSLSGRQADVGPTGDAAAFEFDVSCQFGIGGFKYAHDLLLYQWILSKIIVITWCVESLNEEG